MNKEGSFMYVVVYRKRESELCGGEGFCDYRFGKNIMRASRNVDQVFFLIEAAGEEISSWNFLSLSSSWWLIINIINISIWTLSPLNYTPTNDTHTHPWRN